MALVLVHLDPARLIYLETDASGSAIAGIILQKLCDICNCVDSAARIWGPSRTSH
jgi:hypothetical protein